MTLTGEPYSVYPVVRKIKRQLLVGRSDDAHSVQPSLLLSNTHTGFALMTQFNATHSELRPSGMERNFPYIATSITKNSAIGSNVPLTAFALLANQMGQQIKRKITGFAVGGGKMQEGNILVPALVSKETRFVNLS